VRWGGTSLKLCPQYVELLAHSANSEAALWVTLIDLVSIGLRRREGAVLETVAEYWGSGGLAWVGRG